MAQKLTSGVNFCGLNGGVFTSTAKPCPNLTASDLNCLAAS
ncbi:hypothetical protein [uncultured Campylobacter sp.]|nr:hypothetical protein [uncultured Campylobacter sp.]